MYSKNQENNSIQESNNFQYYEMSQNSHHQFYQQQNFNTQFHQQSSNFQFHQQQNLNLQFQQQQNSDSQTTKQQSSDSPLRKPKNPNLPKRSETGRINKSGKQTEKKQAEEIKSETKGMQYSSNINNNDSTIFNSNQRNNLQKNGKSISLKKGSLNSSQNQSSIKLNDGIHVLESRIKELEQKVIEYQKDNSKLLTTNFELLQKNENLNSELKSKEDELLNYRIRSSYHENKLLDFESNAREKIKDLENKYMTLQMAVIKENIGINQSLQNYKSQE